MDSRRYRQWGGAAVAGAFIGALLSGAEASAQTGCLLPAGDIDGSDTTNVGDVQCAILTNLWSLSGAVTQEPGCLDDTIYVDGPNLDYINGADINCDGNNDVLDVQLTIFHALSQPLPTALDINQDKCVDICLFDSDADGINNAGDCAPYDPRIGINKLDVCDAVDNNCNSVIDVPIGPGLIPAQPAEDCENGLLCDGQATCPAMPTGTSLVITEIMVNPDVSAPATTATARWVEIFNPTANDIDLRNWRLAGPNSGLESFTVTGPRPVIIRAGGFAVFVANADFALNGGIAGNRGFRVIPYTGITMIPAGDAIQLINPQGVQTDIVTWNAAWAALVNNGAATLGRSIRFSLSQIQTDPGGIATNNNNPANWGLSTIPWQPAGQEIVPGDPGEGLTVASDFGSPGGLWVSTQPTPAPEMAGRCVAGTPSSCNAEIPAQYQGLACVEASCFEPGMAHPNQGSGGIGIAATAGSDPNFNPLTGCLEYVAAAYENDNAQHDAGSCNDGRSCTDQICVLRVTNTAGGFTSPDGCHYTASTTPGDTCGIGGSDAQCNASFCVLDKSIADGDEAAVLASGLYTIAGGIANDTFDGVTGCYADIRTAVACSDGNGCTENERCGAAGVCDDYTGMGGISQAQADANCNVDGLSCTLDAAIPGPGDTCACRMPTGVTDANYYQTGFCAIAGACVANDDAQGAGAAVSCLRCNDDIDRTAWTFDPAQEANRCFIGGTCFTEGDVRMGFECQACQRDGMTFTDTDALSWSNRNTDVVCDAANVCDISTCGDSLAPEGGTCVKDADWELANNNCPNTACAEPEACAVDGGGLPSCVYGPLDALEGATQCFLGDSPAAILTGACIADGADDPANYCMECRAAVSADGYSAKDITTPIYCDAAQTGNAVTLVDFELNGDSDPCTVHTCNAAGTCAVSGTANWADYTFPGQPGEACPEIACAADVCDPNVGGPTRCLYTHVGVANPGGDQCLLTTLTTGAANPAFEAPSGTNGAFTTAGNAPACVADAFQYGGVANSCTECDTTQAVRDLSARTAGTVCRPDGGALTGCTHFTCDGAGTCDNQGDWALTFCNTLPDAGCGAPPAANFECELGGSGVLAGTPAGTFYYTSNAAPTALDQTGINAIAANFPFCSVDTTQCGTTCSIGGNTFQRGALNPNNQCEWCNPDASATAWSARVAGTPTPASYADTLAAAISILSSGGNLANWTFGTTQLGDICRDASFGGAMAAGVDGNACTVERCVADADGAGPGTAAGCANPVAWETLQTDYLTPIVDNSDGLANCLERAGNTPAGTDVSTCVNKTCTSPGSVATCTLVANGGDTPGTQCFIGNRCHDALAGNPFGTGGAGTAYLTGQCAVCNVQDGVPATYTNWLNLADGLACNRDNNGCTLDTCQAGVCTAGGSPAVADAFTCTTDVCIDHTSDNLAFATSNDPANDYADPLAGITAFPEAAREALRQAAQTFNDGHTINTGSCLIGGECYLNNVSAVGEDNGIGGTYDPTGRGNNGNCAFCLTGATANTQVGMDGGANPVNTQTSWSPGTNRPCNDEISCSVNDRCGALPGACDVTVTIDAVCNDGNPCTVDRCDTTGTLALANPIVSGDDAFITGVNDLFAGCEYYAAPTTQTCDDVIQSGPLAGQFDLCTFSTTCAAPGGQAAGGATAGTIYGNSRGQCQHGSLDDAEPEHAANNLVVCDDLNECTYTFCQPNTGACINQAVPNYFTGEHATTGAAQGGGDGVPLKLGLTPAQVFDPGFAYLNTSGTGMNPALVATAIPRRCDLTDWCTAGTCNAAGFCIVTDQSDTAPVPANRKCQNPANFTDNDNNSCTRPACDANAGTWSDDPGAAGIQWTVFTPATNPDILDPGSLSQNNGCYLATVAANTVCNEAEIVADASDAGLSYDAVCVNAATSTCNAAGQCQFQQVTCSDGGDEFDTSCRTYTCSAALGSTLGAQCRYALNGASPTCNDRNDCTTSTCVEDTNIDRGNANRVQCVSALDGAPALSGQVAACAEVGDCHPSIGWHPGNVLLSRLNTASPVAGFAGAGTGLLNSTAQLSAAQRAALDAAEGNPANFDLNDNGTINGFSDIISCAETPTNDVCTGPDICLSNGSCNTAPVPNCFAENTNTLCVLVGAANSIVECPIRLAAGATAHTMGTDPNVAFTLQMDVEFPGANVTLLTFVDDICFAGVGCFGADDDTIPALNNTIYPYGHQVSVQPTALADWNLPINNGGRLILSNLTPARLNMAHFNPSLDINATSPAAVATEMAKLTNMDPDADPTAPTLFRMRFQIGAQDILPTNPVIVYASDIISTREDATLLDVDVWNRIIVTKPLALSPGCAGQPNGTACDDGDACTLGDSCVNGSCVAGVYFEGQNCSDGEQCTYQDACVIGTCESEPLPECTNAAANLACAITGADNEFFDCWLNLAANAATPTAQAVAHQFDITWDNAAVDLVGAFDKIGTPIVTTAPGGLLTGTNIVTQDLGAPAPSHAAYTDPFDPTTATNTLGVLAFPLLFTNEVTSAVTADGGVTVTHVPATDATPGQWLRLRFQLLNDIPPTTPSLVTYAVPAVPTSAAASVLNYTVTNRVMITSP